MLLSHFLGTNKNQYGLENTQKTHRIVGNVLRSLDFITSVMSLTHKDSTTELVNSHKNASKMTFCMTFKTPKRREVGK